MIFMSTRTEYLPLHLFSHFENLKMISVILTYTKMASPKNGHFLLANSLEEINFVNQRFEELGGRVFEGCTKIKSILLDNNEINTLDEDTFADLRTLEALSMSSNEITALPLKVFSTLKSLKLLDLSSNMISTLAKTTFDSNRFLDNVKLNRNRFLNLPPIQLAEETNYELTDSFCVDRDFQKTTELNAYTSKRCNITDIDPYDLISAYLNQIEINQICGDKNMVTNLGKDLTNLVTQKNALLKKRENLGNEIVMTKIYKNSLC